MAAPISRNSKIHGSNTELGDFLDFEYFLSCSDDGKSNAYYAYQNRVLIKLVSYVIKNELTEKQRAAVELVKKEGLTYGQAGKILGINKSSVCRHLQYAQKKLDRAYEHYIYVRPFITDD